MFELSLVYFCCTVLGQVLPYENIQDIIKFCHEEELVLLADEVKHCIIMFQIPDSRFQILYSGSALSSQASSQALHFETNLTG